MTVKVGGWENSGDDTLIPEGSERARSNGHFTYVVEAENLIKRFNHFTAVNGINFKILPGECFGILGPNGAGKTTTIRMVYGFSPMTDGELKVFGLDICKDWRRIKASIGVCQQENSLDPDLTVLQNLEVFARYFDIPKKVAHERADELLTFFALEHRQDAPVSELSGGMIRRLVLARALINNPSLLILDEPTTGLDPQSRHQVWDRLADLRKRGISILLTTHYMEEASQLCDRLIIIDHGLILVEGRPGDLITYHVGRDVIEVNDPSEGLRSFLQSQGLEVEDLGHRLVIYSEDRGDLYERITRDFCREGCVMRMATLEDVFLKLTGRELRE
jgi:lipooligosaccharide transport system ATP-binding protein